MIRKPSILITGAGGEVGSELIKILSLHENINLVTLDLHPINNENSHLVNAQITGYILDKNLINQINLEFEIKEIYHLAAILSTRAELSPKIRVNCIAPSLTESKMSLNLVKNENIKKGIEMMHPIPKIGTGGDFSDIGAYLLSEKNNWITGQILHIDGGRSSLRIKA